MLRYEVERQVWAGEGVVVARVWDRAGRFPAFWRSWTDEEFRSRFRWPLSLRAHLTRESWGEAKAAFGEPFSNSVRSRDIIGSIALLFTAIATLTTAVVLVGCQGTSFNPSPIVESTPVSDWSTQTLEEWALSPRGLETREMAIAFDRLRAIESHAGIVKAIVIARKRPTKGGFERTHVRSAREYVQTFNHDAVIAAIHGDRRASELSVDELLRRYEELISP